MDFWNTVRGVQLADTLIRELPRLEGPKEQILITIENNPRRDMSGREISQSLERLKEAMERRYRIVTSFPMGMGHTVIVMERSVE